MMTLLFILALLVATGPVLAVLIIATDKISPPIFTDARKEVIPPTYDDKRKPYGPSVGGLVLPQTESERNRQWPAVGASERTPEGPGRDGYKPLMRNRVAHDEAISDRVILPATIFRQLITISNAIERV